MLTIFLEMARIVLVLSSSLWTLPDLRKLQKFFQQQGFHSVESTQKFLVSVHIVLGLKLSATTVEVLHMAIALTNLVIVSVGKDVNVFLQTLHGQTFFFLLLSIACVVHQILAAVKPQVTAVAEKMSSSTGLFLYINTLNSLTHMHSTPSADTCLSSCAP